MSDGNGTATLLLPPALARTRWQPTIFAEKVRRVELQGLQASWPLRKIAIAVHRNTPFEFVADSMSPFLAYAGLEPNFLYSDYDDTLQFGSIEANLHIVWLDFEGYRGTLDGLALADWLSGRIGELRARTTAPILVANWPSLEADAAAFNNALAASVGALPGVRLYDRRLILETLGERYWDRRLQSVGSTSVSGTASMAIARDLALRWIPAALRPRLKCIALDFDHTLYKGVLGEDGVGGVELTPQHRALQERLLELRGEGVLLAALSKNEAEDVERLLAERTDFPLRREHLSAFSVSWDSKAEGLGAIAAALHIGTDAILFLDDNLGEIADVAARHPDVRTVHSADPSLALAALTMGPDLVAWGSSVADGLRADDLAAEAKRASELANAIDPLAYLAALATRLDFALNPEAAIGRIHELSNKTNQFNLALKRLTEAATAEWLDAPGPRAVTIALSDRLSDSGVIGMMLLDLRGETLFVEELCISCRALGRKLEDLMIATAIEGALEDRSCREIAFAHATGPRNAPARTWLAGLAGRDICEESGYVHLAWPFAGENLWRRLPVETAW